MEGQGRCLKFKTWVRIILLSSQQTSQNFDIKLHFKGEKLVFCHLVFLLENGFYYTGWDQNLLIGNRGQGLARKCIECNDHGSETINGRWSIYWYEISVPDPGVLTFMLQNFPFEFNKTLHQIFTTTRNHTVFSNSRRLLESSEKIPTSLRCSASNTVTTELKAP